VLNAFRFTFGAVGEDVIFAAVQLKRMMEAPRTAKRFLFAFITNDFSKVLGSFGPWNYLLSDSLRTLNSPMSGKERVISIRSPVDSSIALAKSLAPLISFISSGTK